MRITYTITEEPTGTDYLSVAAFTERRLTIDHGGRALVDAEGILLVELAIVLCKWLRRIRRGETADLYYASMDFEEEPIFALRFDEGTDQLSPASVWGHGSPPCVSTNEAASAAEAFLMALGDDLAGRLGINLTDVIGRAAGDNQ